MSELILYDMIKKQQELINKLTEQNNLNEIELSYLRTRIHNVVGFIQRITNAVNNKIDNKITNNQVDEVLKEFMNIDYEILQRNTRDTEDFKNKRK